MLLSAPDEEFQLTRHGPLRQGTGRGRHLLDVDRSVGPGGADGARSGRITARRRGVHTLVLRYLDRVAAVQVIVPLADKPVDLSGLPRNNPIDDEVLSLLAVAAD